VARLAAWPSVAPVPVGEPGAAGCPDRLVCEHVIATLVHGSGYERIASPGCSDRTIRRRLQPWAAGLTKAASGGEWRRGGRPVARGSRQAKASAEANRHGSAPLTIPS
jgi:hypothetical protein